MPDYWPLMRTDEGESRVERRERKKRISSLFTKDVDRLRVVRVCECVVSDVGVRCANRVNCKSCVQP